MTAELWQELRDAGVIDLSQPYRNGMPQSPNHPPFRLIMERRHGDVVRADGGSAANEMFVLGGHVGTHVDALAHVSQDGYAYGHRDVRTLQTNRGLSELGIDDFHPMVGRGVLLDVTAVHGVATLPAGYEITVDDLEKAKHLAGVPLMPGDAILIGTGWSRRWHERDAFIGLTDGVPGPGVEAASWLAEHQPRAVGGETITFERLAPGAGHALLPVHRIMLVEAGINIIETMRLVDLLDAGADEFVFILNPLSIIGATGAPVRPLAVLPR
jgi:kynurenine formamidase